LEDGDGPASVHLERGPACFGGWTDAIPISVNFTYTIGAVASIQPQ
jgi:hypothetical protein